jgi:hypothetical protein
LYKQWDEANLSTQSSVAVNAALRWSAFAVGNYSCTLPNLSQRLDYGNLVVKD